MKSYAWNYFWISNNLNDEKTDGGQMHGKVDHGR